MTIDYVKLAEKVGDIIAKAGVQAYSGAIRGVQYEAAGCIIANVLCILGFSTAFSYLKNVAKETEDSDLQDAIFFVSLACCALAAVSFIVFVFHLPGWISSMFAPDWTLIKTLAGK